MKNYDIIVLGGGFTGCAAAVAAARQGQKVLLIEVSGSLGGAASTCLVYPFMSNHTMMENEDGTKWQNRLTRGIFAEIFEKIRTADDLNYFDDNKLKLVLDELLIGAGVEVLFHATLCGVEKNGTHIESLSVATKAGVLSFGAKIFIDATGDADLCVMAGVETHLGREDNLCQPMTLCFRVGNVDKTQFFESKNYSHMQRLYKEWKNAGNTINPREDLLAFRYPVEGVVHFNTTRVVKLSPVDPFDVSKAEMIARRQVEEIMQFFRENEVAGMEKAELIFSAQSIGVRESRMLVGEHVLTGEELVACTKFEDAIAAGNYDLDIHNPEGGGTSHHLFKPGTWYTIPYRALTPKRAEVDNLLVGGRCISVDHEAQASVRIMPICGTTGEAAGVAASVANRTGVAVQDADVSEIQRIIVESGGYIGL